MTDQETSAHADRETISMDRISFLGLWKPVFQFALTLQVCPDNAVD
jgi:hypothetical protein